MKISENPQVTCFGAIADAKLAAEIAGLCNATSCAVTAFPEPNLLFEQLSGQDADFIILDSVFLEESVDAAADLQKFIEEMRKIRPGMPVLLLLPSSSSEKIKWSVIEAGVTDFLCLPLSKSDLTLRIRSLVQTGFLRRQYHASSRRLEDEIRTTIREILMREFETLSVLGKAAEYKDRETGLHITRVSHYSRLIARMIGVSEPDQDVVFHASALHDIGKLGIPDAILLKPGKLTKAEFEVMEGHCVIGHGILKNSQSNYLLTGAMIALTHHEKYDGTGYPMNLKADEIPLFGRIVGIADVFDALTTRRPYKEPWPLAKAFDFVSKERGKHFDPDLVDAFLSNSRGAEWIFHNHADAKALTGDV